MNTMPVMIGVPENRYVFFVLFFMAYFPLFSLIFFTPIVSLYELDHTGCSVLAVISRMPTSCLLGIHFFSVLGAFKFHWLTPSLKIYSHKL
ncbi:MAG: hypothetical protein D3920_03895 [Candidatus Electrothrix sp. AW2]|nr:hypothetical protein [Candidatus Electrothrix gigas]